MIICIFSSDVDAWDAWDVQDEEENATRHTEEIVINTPNSHHDLQYDDSAKMYLGQSPEMSPGQSLETSVSVAATVRPPPVLDLDINALDVKMSSSGKRRTAANEMDFFADMAPVIPKTMSGIEQFQSELENAIKVLAITYFIFLPHHNVAIFRYF
jgi:hypothetical protein